MAATVSAAITTLKVIRFRKNQQTIFPIKIGLFGFAGFVLIFFH